MRKHRTPFENDVFLSQLRGDITRRRRSFSSTRFFAAGLVMALVWMALALAFLGGATWVVIWVLRSTGVIG